MEYLPTDEMLADFFKKPLKGIHFERLRQVIMGWYHISLLKAESISEFKERIGNVIMGYIIPK